MVNCQLQEIYDCAMTNSGTLTPQNSGSKLNFWPGVVSKLVGSSLLRRVARLVFDLWATSSCLPPSHLPSRPGSDQHVLSLGTVGTVWHCCH